MPTVPFRLAVGCSALALSLSACVPDLDSDESTVGEARVLAVQADPAEATPGQQVTYRALLVDAKGARDDGALTWFYCNAPKPLAELGPINPDCLRAARGQLTKIGEGLSTQGTLPTGACSLFGPNPPPPVEGQLPGRPADPDSTGGYKLPIMLAVELGNGQDVLLYEQRIACGLSGVNPRTSVEFAQRYHRNENPRISALRVVREGGDEEDLDEDSVLDLNQGERVELEVRWPSCPDEDRCGDAICGADETAQTCAEDCTTLVGCAGQERYVWFDAEQRTLSVLRESLRAAWYATAGVYKDERTGVGEGETARGTRNLFTAPNKRGDLTLWVVLRDARGGVGFREQRVRVR